MLNLPRRGRVPTPSRYESLGLRDLPFPTEPAVNPYSSDPRRNGTIYAELPARAGIEKFERLLIRPDDFSNRVRIAYLWSKGDRQSGRGMGKTALLRYFRQRINKDWGQSEFQGQFSAAVIYVSFPSQIDRRYMEQLALSALVDICKNGILEASRASIRLEFLTSEQAKAVLKYPDGSENPDNLLNDDILRENGIQTDDLDAEVARRLREEGIQSRVALALAQGRFEEHLRSMRRDGNLEPLYVPYDTKILDYSRSLLFNDMVYYLRTAGFAGGYLFIDDIENLVDQMTRKSRIEFAKEFGLCTIRPGYANTAHNFFSNVLTTHQQASVGLSQAWGDAGLSAIARLEPASPNSVELPLPEEDQARAILVAHLDHYRIDERDKGTIKPFTEAGMNALLGNQQMLHPRVLLATAANVVLAASTAGAAEIDVGTVTSVVAGATSLPTPDFSEGIEDAI